MKFCRMQGIALAGSLALVVTGCRSVQGVLGNRDADSRVNVNWVNPVDLEPVDPTGKKILIRYKDFAPATEFAYIQSAIEEEARNLGFEVTNSLDEADYYYKVSLRAFQENPNADDGATLLAAAGAVAGGVGGYAAGAELTDSWAGGVAVGALAGAATHSFIDNHTRVTEWNLLVDFAIGERVEGGVETGYDSDQSNNANVQTGAGLSGQQGISGNDNRSNSTSQSMKKNRPFFIHSGRMLAVARQIKMTREEAIAALESDVKSILPMCLPY